MNRLLEIFNKGKRQALSRELDSEHCPHTAVIQDGGETESYGALWRNGHLQQHANSEMSIDQSNHV